MQQGSWLFRGATLRWIAVEGTNQNSGRSRGSRRVRWRAATFSLEQRLGTDKRVLVEGRVLFPENDVQIKLALEKSDLGFVRAGFEEWRRYYDDSGGYYRPFSLPSFDLNRDLYLNNGHAWIDFGLILQLTPDRGRL